MHRIKEDIKNRTFGRVYLLYGEETYLRHQYRDSLRDAIVNKDDTMNYHYFSGKQSSFGEIIDMAETMPFLTEYKVIVIENSGACNQSSDQIADYIEGIPESTIMIFVEEKVNAKTKLYKAIAKHGCCVNFERQSEQTLEKWIASRLKQEGKVIRKNTVELLLEKTGVEMEQISMELEKIICYTYGREEVTSDDVELVVSGRVQSEIYGMLRGILDKNQKVALDLYYDLLSAKESPVGILAALTGEFKNLYHVKLLLGLSYQEQVIAKELGLHPFRVKNYVRQGRGIEVEVLRSRIEECVMLDEMIKTGRENGQIGVELLIVRYSTK